MLQRKLPIRFWRKNICTGKKYCSTLEVYDKIPIFIPVDITEDVFESVAHKFPGVSGPSGTESDALQGWLLKFKEDIKKLRVSVENFVDWLSNQNPPWASYRSFVSGRLISIDKRTDVRTVGIGETWKHIFTKCVMRITGPEANNAYQDYHLYSGLKA